MNLLFAGPRRLALLLTLAALIPSSAGAAAVSSARASDLAEVARSIGRGASMRIEGTSIDGFADAAGLDLVRFEPVASGARFVLQTGTGPRVVKPELPVYLRGSVDGMRGSVVVLSVRPSGELRGVVSGAEGTWMLERGVGARDGMRSRRIEREALAAAGSFECERLDNPGTRRTAASAASASLAGSTSAASTPTSSAAETASMRLPIAYTAQIAVELDYDFYQLFAPDGDAAILYALDLMAFTGALGESELGMNVQVPFLQMWTTSADPYSGAIQPRLLQFQALWNQAVSTHCGGASCTTVARSTALMMSAAGNGGIAYVPGLCDSWWAPTNGYSYAFAGSMDGDFDINSPGVVWDIMVTTHELGHNFGSDHTHCYEPPVDACYSGESAECHNGSTSLPSGCPGSGQGCGTIMSYCHGLGGGLGNVSLTYGAGHPYGNTPQRVPDAMINRLQMEALAMPACLTPTDGMVNLAIEKNGTGSGTVTSQPAGIDCGSGCSTYFNADTVVTLTPTPGTFSQFTGWSGDADCNDGIVTASVAKTCTATFDGSCGAGNQDCEDHNPCTADSCPGDDHCENTGTPRDASSCFANARTKLTIGDSSDPTRDKLQWQWTRGDAFAQSDLFDPSLTTDYALCIYDATGDVTTLAASLSLPGGNPNWSNRSPKGWKWSDRNGTVGGLTKLDLRTGIAGKSKVKLRAGGTNLSLPGPQAGSEYFDQDSSVIVQLLAGEDSCWTSTFVPADTSRSTTTLFKASGN
ncbi:MAG: M12 family metallo-peptidase [Candidatus Binatia bacterium]